MAIMDASSSISRRRVLALAGGGTLALAGIGAGSFALNGVGRASATIQVESEDKEITTEDGTISEITVSVSGYAEYSGFDGQVTDLKFITTANGEQFFTTDINVEDAEFRGAAFQDIGASEGTFEYSEGYGRISPPRLFERTSLSAENFAATEDGSSKSTDINFTTEFQVISDGEILESTSGSTTITITVHNEDDTESGAGSGGNGSGPEPEASFEGVTIDVSIIE